jgi:hypothetical protein
MSSEGLSVIAGAFAMNRGVKRLRLSRTQMSADGARVLASG